MSRVTHDESARGLDWVVRNRKRYDIRIVNVSCGGDYEASYLRDALSQAAERATAAGILVCAAVGNQGTRPAIPCCRPRPRPPCSPWAALDDHNRLAFAGYDMYHSSYGPTVDGLQKPEVIAPGIWVAAPILPGTPTAAQAQLLPRCRRATDGELKRVIAGHPGVDADLDAAPAPRAAARAPARGREDAGNNVISGAYKHVDGTSFAAPIVLSIAAQMIEANPALCPRQSSGC
jgi:serine protease AprX